MVTIYYVEPYNRKIVLKKVKVISKMCLMYVSKNNHNALSFRISIHWNNSSTSAKTLIYNYTYGK